MPHVRKQGDCSRRRRFSGSPARRKWYADYRRERFARHMLKGDSHDSDHSGNHR